MDVDPAPDSAQSLYGPKASQNAVSSSAPAPRFSLLSVARTRARADGYRQARPGQIHVLLQRQPSRSLLSTITQTGDHMSALSGLRRGRVPNVHRRYDATPLGRRDRSFRASASRRRVPRDVQSRSRSAATASGAELFEASTFRADGPTADDRESMSRMEAGGTDSTVPARSVEHKDYEELRT